MKTALKPNVLFILTHVLLGSKIFNRPGVAGAVLQTALSFID